MTDILKIDSSVADEEACQMEHGMSPETLNRLAMFMEFVQIRPRAGSNWLKNSEEYALNDPKPDK